MQNLREKLSALRRRAGLSQKELADRLALFVLALEGGGVHA